MADSLRLELAGRVEATASRLRIDAATSEVLRAFENAGIHALLLKGPALAEWYAHNPAYSYLDCDLWVGPADVNAAGEALTCLGFNRVFDDRALPAWWREHAGEWSRELDGVLVDLHGRLQGMGVDAQTAWQALSSTTATATVAGYPAPVLAVPARALYVTLHAAHHGKQWGKAVLHVERALQAVEESAWVQAASLAEQLGATESFAAGLRLTTQGAELAARLSLPATQSRKVALHASTPPPIALGVEQLASAESITECIRIILRKTLPPPGFIRHWWPAASRNHAMLAIAYLYRPLWLLRHAPRGLRAWLIVRREVGAGH